MSTYSEAIQLLANIRMIQTLQSEINRMQGANTMSLAKIHASGVDTGVGTIGGRGPLKHFVVADHVRYLFDTEEEMAIFLCEYFLEKEQGKT